jgi:hypothetical protein
MFVKLVASPFDIVLSYAPVVSEELEALGSRVQQHEVWRRVLTGSIEQLPVLQRMKS